MTASLSADDFISKWRAVELKERSAAQEHFIDLCRLLDEPTPADADPTGQSYCFERGATKTTGSDGWADVWKRGHFGWEYKGKRKDLNAAFVQLQQYALALENPPLLVTCDMDRFVIRTNWTNTVSETHQFGLDDLRDPLVRQKLKWVMSDPEALRPGKTRQELTEDAAAEFAALAHKLRSKGHAPETVAHFVNRLVFCMFAEDAGLLPNNMFTQMLQAARDNPDQFQNHAATLFSAMKDGGLVGFTRIEWFNGGLFDDAEALPLEEEDVELCLRAAALDWSEIDPSIFGTLFVRGLDPDKRTETGAEYTDRDKIMMIIEPVLTQPLLREWEDVRQTIGTIIEPAQRRLAEAVASASKFPELAEEVRAVSSRVKERTQLELFEGLKKQKRVRTLDAVRASLRAADRARSAAMEQGQALLDAFLARLRDYRILDPACGSGNFLYLALIELKNIERRVAIEGELFGFPPKFPAVGPESLLGIEISPYAAELARVSVWIGEIQWMRRNGFDVPKQPILRPLQTIECRDALLTILPPSEGAEVDDQPPAWTESDWPKADIIIGNPPFLGGVDHLSILTPSPDYANALRSIYRGRVRARADLVVYWIQKATELLIKGEISYFGLVATKSVAKGVSRTPLDLISASAEAELYCAWTNEPWTVEGAAVRVSIVCARRLPSEGNLILNGVAVDRINPDLTTGLDITVAKPIADNHGIALQGVKLTGPFDISGDEARALLSRPLNPNGRPNSDVVRRLYDIDDIVGRDSDRWVVDFGTKMSRAEAALYEEPFAIVTSRVVPFRENPDLCRSTEPRLDQRFWEFQRPRPKLRQAVRDLTRYIVTPESSEHRVFVFLPKNALIQGSLFAIARDDYVTFGVLSSTIHEIWATAQGNRLGVGNQRRYNIGVAFDTFPFPNRLAPNLSSDGFTKIPEARPIADAAAKLDQLRQSWLNPVDLVVEDRLDGYCRLVPKNDEAARLLRTRTLTDLYNLKPQWLQDAHAELDRAVAAAYGWPADISTDEALERLLQLNLSRAANSSR